MLLELHREDILSGLTILALAVLTSGYLVGSWRRGKSESVKEAMDLAQQEIALLKSARDHAENERKTLEAEMRETSAACKEDIARLSGVVDQLRNENSELRGLVMLEKVPPPLESALKEIVVEVMQSVRDMHINSNQILIEHFDKQLEQNREYWTSTIGDRLHPIEQGIARLLIEEGGET